MRANGEDKRVAAGTDAMAGNLSQTGCKPCIRPNPNGSASLPTLGLGSGALLGLLLAAGAAVGAAVFLAQRGEGDVTNQGGVIVVSPTR
jgi:hypothetical protein